MSIKSILVPVGGDDSDREVLDTALVVARRFDGHILALHVMPRPEDAAPFMFDRLSRKLKDTVMQETGAASREQAAAVRATFEDFCARNGISGETPGGGVSASWHETFGVVADTIVSHARVCDAVTIARPRLESGALRRSPAGRNLQAVLLSAGRPLVVVPPAWEARRIEHAAIGWNGSLEASRALAMTIPWLTQMREVTVIVSEKRRAAATQVLEYLRRHAVSARVQTLEPERSVGTAMLAGCQEAGAELLVVGGFSHSRSRQLLFGGVTQHLLTHAEIVTVMVH